MNKYLNILLILLIPCFVFAQRNEYKSKEQKNYYKKINYKPFKPISKRKIEAYKNDFFEFHDLTDYSLYYDSLYFTPYQDSVYESYDSEVMYKPQFIGAVEKEQIIKYEKKENFEAIIYTCGKFEDKYFGETGIWVAFSSDNGKSWEYFYTGIVQRQPLYLKWYSKVPLIKSGKELQIEASLLQQLNSFSHPGPGPSYGLIKDGLILTLDLNTLRKDSDLDGLTDIIERKFFTNLNNKDTDGDKIPDNLDLNPRFATPRTDKTIIYELAVNEEISRFDSIGVTKFSNTLPKINYASDSTEIILIITDNPDIQSIQPQSRKVIIVSEKEYKKQKGLFRNKLNDMSISPLFKVDNMTDTFIFTRSFNTWGERYLVKKTKLGWKIIIYSSWIS